MIQNLQSLRGLAAILIFYHHYGFSSTIVQSFGDFGVVFFMMLSGFVLYMSAERRRNIEGKIPTARKFMQSRLTKIYPLYLLCWISAIIIMPYSGSQVGKILGFFALQSWVPAADVYFSGNAVAWFISDIIFCYLLFTPIHRLIINRPHTFHAFTIAYFAFYFAVVAFTPEEHEHGIIYINPLMQLANFIIGIYICRAYLSTHTNKDIPHAGICQTSALILVACCMLLYGEVSPRLTLGSYWWIPCGLTIYIFAKTDTEQTPLNKAMQQKAFLTIGKLSFSLYLIHMIGIYIWERAIALCGHEYAQSIYLQFAQSIILLIILIFASSLIHSYFEDPVSKFLKPE